MAKDWTGNTKSTWAALAASNHSESERETNDYYATDPKALDKFLQKANEDGLILNEPLWECACGEGHLSKCLEKHGYKVISSDLIDRGFGNPNVDFLKTEFLWGGHNYKPTLQICTRICRTCFETCRKRKTDNNVFKNTISGRQEKS